MASPSNCAPPLLNETTRDKGGPILQLLAALALPEILHFPTSVSAPNFNLQTRNLQTFQRLTAPFE